MWACTTRLYAGKRDAHKKKDIRRASESGSLLNKYNHVEFHTHTRTDFTQFGMSSYLTRARTCEVPTVRDPSQKNDQIDGIDMAEWEKERKVFACTGALNRNGRVLKQYVCLVHLWRYCYCCRRFVGCSNMVTHTAWIDWMWFTRYLSYSGDASACHLFWLEIGFFPCISCALVLILIPKTLGMLTATRSKSC